MQLLRTLDVDIALRAISVFASAEAAADWLIAEGLASLNGKSAVETAQTVKGRQRVLALLGAIEHGVYT
ncbi:MbcA/ParS/Xre antitoxin family protein [Opitutus terrae]|uniref:MbcA/ParS/Xre antitoxin family protein n=1 Tax=Opitutus terrae TaxID=107709 RepID=UPI0013054328|nr:MbcA/ParS/Xre antitoxin family protein [Opitutus terrae]